MIVFAGGLVAVLMVLFIVVLVGVGYVIFWASG